MAAVDDLKKLIAAHERRLQDLKTQPVGRAAQPPADLQIEIENIEAQLAGLQADLEALEELPQFNPYRGLAAFREEDAPFFFGRERVTAELVRSIQRKSVTTLLGPAGSGKSSLVFAGLLPYLGREGGWRVAAFRPGPAPFLAVAAALLPLLEPNASQPNRVAEIRRLARALSEGDLPLSEAVNRLLAKSAEADRFLLIADQFEELYTLCPDQETRRRFLDFILAPLADSRSLTGDNHPPAPRRLLLLFRTDFLAQVLTHPPLAETLRGTEVALGPLSAEGLGQAIEKPAARQGVSFEAGLVERIRADVGQEPDRLPLLEFALAELWTRQWQGQMTHVAYETIDRVAGALSRRAEQFFTGLSEGDQEQARRLFEQLIQPGRGTEDTRRPVLRRDLEEGGWRAARQATEAGLTIINSDPAGRERVELAHEILIRTWGRLQVWLQTGRAFRMWQERLRLAVDRWRAAGHDEAALPGGALLAEAEEQLAERAADLNQAEREFIRAGLEARDREAAEREAGRQQALEKARRRAEEQAQLVEQLQTEQQRLEEQLQAVEAEARGRETVEQGPPGSKEESLPAGKQAQETRRVRRQGAVYLVGALLLILVAGGAALFFANRANEAAAVAQDQSRLALAHSLAAMARRPDPDRTVRTLLAIESLRLNRQADGAAYWLIDDALRTVLAGAALDRTLRGHDDFVRAVAFSPDGDWLASGGSDQTVRLWPVAEPEAEPVILRGHDNWVRAVAFSPDGAWLASGGGDRTVRLWPVGEPEAEPVILRGHADSVRAVAFSPDGAWLASGSDDRMVRLWPVGEPAAEPVILSGHEAGVRAAAFSPDGAWLASGSDDQTVRLWPVGEPAAEPLVLRGPEGSVSAVAFSPDGVWLAGGSDDRTVRLWRAAEPAAWPVVLRGHDDFVWSVAFSPNSDWLASGSSDQTVRLWPVAKPEAEPIILQGHDDFVWSVAFSPAGDWLASGSDDRTARLWRWRPEQLAAFGCRQVRRNLSLAEWRRYIPGQDYHQTCPELPPGPGVSFVR